MHQCESDDHVNVVSESDRYRVSVEVWVTGLARSWPARLYFTHSQYKLLTVYLYLELTRTTAGCCSTQDESERKEQERRVFSNENEPGIFNM